jgi:hypothetical protein
LNVIYSASSGKRGLIRNAPVTKTGSKERHDYQISLGFDVAWTLLDNDTAQNLMIGVVYDRAAGGFFFIGFQIYYYGTTHYYWVKILAVEYSYTGVVGTDTIKSGYMEFTPDGDDYYSLHADLTIKYSYLNSTHAFWCSANLADMSGYDWELGNDQIYEMVSIPKMYGTTEQFIIKDTPLYPFFGYWHQYNYAWTADILKVNVS